MRRLALVTHRTLTRTTPQTTCLVCAGLRTCQAPAEPVSRRQEHVPAVAAVQIWRQNQRQGPKPLSWSEAWRVCAALDTEASQQAAARHTSCNGPRELGEHSSVPHSVVFSSTSLKPCRRRCDSLLAAPPTEPGDVNKVVSGETVIDEWEARVEDQDSEAATFAVKQWHRGCYITRCTRRGQLDWSTE